MAKWVKTTPFGDYKDTPDRKKRSSQEHIVTEAKRLATNGKHAGSKPLHRLIRNIARAHESLKI